MTAECEPPQTVGTTSGADVNTEQFFRHALPSAGLKILAELVDIPGRDKPGWRYTTYESIDAMAEAALQIDATGRTVYHACNGFGPWHPHPKKPGQRQIRDQGNVVACRALYDDIDIGKADTYATRKEAGTELKSFILTTHLPMPTIIYSGGGMHLYWAFTKDVAPQDWQRVANKKRLVTQHFGLKIDTACDLDTARVLRPVGTTWRKTEDRTVTCKLQSPATNLETIESILDFYIVKHGLTSAVTSKSDIPEWMKGEVGNLEGQGIEFPPSHLAIIAEACQQIRIFKATGGESEPIWHAVAGIAKHCVDGNEKFHEWSALYAGYSYQETQEKLDNWTAGPTTCEKFKSVSAEGCAGCKHTCRSPISLGVSPQEVALPEWLSEMNAQYAWIKQDAGIYRLQYRDFILPDRFHSAHANQTMEVKVGKTTKDISYSRMFLCAKQRSQFNAIVTRPGEPPVTSDGCLNDWAGFTLKPIAGDVTPWLKVFAWLFGQDHFPLRWMAHLIQHPGIKMFVGLVVWSQSEGVGKNLLFETLGELLSPHHYALISQSEVDDDFCGWIPGTVFVVADEVRASKSDKSRDRLKLWQTSTSLRTHDKGQPKRIVENLMNLVFLSNHADGMFLGDHDRRYYVHEVTNGPLPESLKREFLAWRENGGQAHLLHYLLNLDLGQFDPKGRAPVTTSKAAMIEAGRSDIDRWAMDVVSGAIPIGKEVATAEELTGKFLAEYPQVRTAPPVATMGRVFVKMGAYRRENQVRLSNGRKVRAVALTRVDYWKDQPETAWRAEMEKR